MTNLTWQPVHQNGVQNGSPDKNHAKKMQTGNARLSREVHQLVKVQRRIRGTITSVGHEAGECVILSEKHGSFSFAPRSVKPNKNHPDRVPQVNDPCEFRLSHLNPPTAVSIRVAVPKEAKQRDEVESAILHPIYQPTPLRQIPVPDVSGDHFEMEDETIAQVCSLLTEWTPEWSLPQKEEELVSASA